MKESLVLALVLLAALLLIPLLALGDNKDGMIKNPFVTDEAAGKDESIVQPKAPEVIDPNADAQAGLHELLAQADNQGTASAAAPGDLSGQQTAQDSEAVVNEFKILNLTTGELDTISERDYVIGAVSCEMPASFSEEALKAQAVAAHTYALRRKLNQQTSPDETLKGADFSADPTKYLGYMTEQIARDRFGGNFDVYWGKITAACDAVISKVLVYDNQPIVAAYHSMSPGKTEDAKTVWQDSAPYLVPVDSFGDTLAQNYEVKTVLASDDVKSMLTKKYESIKLSTNMSKWFTIGERTESGTVTTLKAGDVTMTGQEARSIFALRSADFTIAYSNKSFTFTTLGYGHGVGMSQYGADYMARQGSTYDEILAHYFTGTALVDESEVGKKT